MNTTKIMLRSTLMAKDIAPKDTGNLAFNSIRAYKTPKGFRLVQLGNSAFYGAIINFRNNPRSTKEANNVGWWTQKVYTAVSDYVRGNLSYDPQTYQRVAKQSKNNVARQRLFEKSIPKVGG